jgi:voltage-dependent calcium channel alpha-2/delta-4
MTIKVIKIASEKIIDNDLQVAHTNLLLVVVDSMYPTCYKRLEVTPVNISPHEYTNSMDDKPCHKIPLNALKRRRLESCFTEHPLEHEIKECGGASGLTMSSLLLYIIIARYVLQLCSFIS